MIEEYDREIGRVKEENSQLRYQKEISERDYQSVMLENNSLMSKLENLENIFVGGQASKGNQEGPGKASKVRACNKKVAGSGKF